MAGEEFPATIKLQYKKASYENSHWCLLSLIGPTGLSARSGML